MYQPAQTVEHTKNGKPAMKYRTQPSMSWPEPDKEDLLTAIDKVEVAAAYDCEINQSSLVDYINLNRLSTISRLENVTRVKVNNDGGNNDQCQVLSVEVHEIRENNTRLGNDLNEAKATVENLRIRISKQEKDVDDAKITIGKFDIKIGEQEEQLKNFTILENKISQQEAQINNLTQQVSDTNVNINRMEKY
jgi:hypothetical protein